MKKILATLRAVKNDRAASWLKSLDALRKDLPANENASRKIKVLMGPSFPLWEPSAALERTIAYGLERRGCQVIPVFCDGIQEEECNCVGGDWSNKGGFHDNCIKCHNKAKQLWNSYGHDVVKLGDWIEERERQDIKFDLNAIKFGDLLKYQKEGIPIGALAAEILVNNYLVASIEMIENAEFLLRAHVGNLIVLKVAYQRILDHFKPDRVISNDSYYGMWAVLECLCKERKIPYYSHWPATNNRIAISHNDAAMNIDFRESWRSFSQLPLSEIDEAEVESWLEGKRGLVLDTTKPQNYEKIDLAVAAIEKEKPTILLAANVIWDLAALNKQIIFSDMINWIADTISWFGQRPNYQLIVKPHPAEVYSGIPRTRETVHYGIFQHMATIPSNVHLLKPDTHVTVDELQNIACVRAVVVHTTTIGFEFPAKGFTSITTAKSPYRGLGFTRDPETKQEYFEEIDRFLSSKPISLSPEQQQLARKFIKFYQFHYYSKLNVFSGRPVNLHKGFIEQFCENSGPLDYILEKIISGSSINSENSWLPKS